MGADGILRLRGGYTLVCDILKRYRAENGLSVEELASGMGLPIEMVIEYERVETYQDAHYMFFPWSDAMKIRELTGRSLLDLLVYLEPDVQKGVNDGKT